MVALLLMLVVLIKAHSLSMSYKQGICIYKGTHVNFMAAYICRKKDDYMGP